MPSHANGNPRQELMNESRQHMIFITEERSGKIPKVFKCGMRNRFPLAIILFRTCHA